MFTYTFYLYYICLQILGCLFPAWSLEPIDITRFFFFSWVMFCQVFNVADFSSYLLLGCLQQLKFMLKYSDQVTNISLFYLKKSIGFLLKCAFGPLTICSLKHIPYFETFGWIRADNIALQTSEFILLLLSAVTASRNIREPVPLLSIHAQVFRWCGTLWISSSLPSPYILYFSSF